MPSGLLPCRTLGQSGIVVSDVGVGCWALGGLDSNLGRDMGWANADDNVSERALQTAFRLGATHYDTADVYGHGRSERVLGQFIRSIDRDHIVVATKLGYFAGTAPHALAPLHMRHQLEMSLANLGTDYVDILYFHNHDFGPQDARLQEALAEMRRFKELGLVRAIGMRGPHRHTLERTRQREHTGNKAARFFELAELIEPDIVQVRFNMLTPVVRGEQNIFQWAADRGIGVVINKPLAQGLLTGKYNPTSSPSFPVGDHRRHKQWFRANAISVLDSRLREIRARFGGDASSLVAVAIGYCLRRSQSCCVLAGIRTPVQATMNIAGPRLELTDEECRGIECLFGGIHDEIGRYFGPG